MKLKIKSIIQTDYKGKVYDLCFNKDHYFFVKHIDNKDLNQYIKIHNSSPDIDSDFEQGSRERIREYLKSKYGKESVFGVSTWTLYQPKSALQDASRGLGKDTSFGSTLMMEVTKLPDLDDAKDLVEFFDNVKKTFNLTPTMLEWFRDNEDTIYWANKLLGLCKNVGTHAGGIVVTPGPIYDYIPVVKAGKEINTAFRESDGSAKDLSELGLLKLDILGLKTLNVIKESINGIKKDLNIDISNNIKYVNLNDKALLRKFNQGNNVGIFQMCGCLDQNTLITLSDNSQKEIKNLKVGDKVISLNEETGDLEEDIVKRQFSTGKKKGFKIVLEDNSEIIASEEHRFLTKRGWIRSFQLTLEDEIISIFDVISEKYLYLKENIDNDSNHKACN